MAKLLKIIINEWLPIMRHIHRDSQIGTNFGKNNIIEKGNVNQSKKRLFLLLPLLPLQGYEQRQRGYYEQRPNCFLIEKWRFYAFVDLLIEPIFVGLKPNFSIFFDVSQNLV